jgi:hypothetical protein
MPEQDVERLKTVRKASVEWVAAADFAEGPRAFRKRRAAEFLE